jgi:hypothetical protein
MVFDPEYIRSRVLHFDKEIFKAKIKDYVEKRVAEHLSRRS